MLPAPATPPQHHISLTQRQPVLSQPGRRPCGLPGCEYRGDTHLFRSLRPLQKSNEQVSLGQSLSLASAKGPLVPFLIRRLNSTRVPSREDRDKHHVTTHPHMDICAHVYHGECPWGGEAWGSCVSHLSWDSPADGDIYKTTPYPHP